MKHYKGEKQTIVVQVAQCEDREQKWNASHNCNRDNDYNNCKSIDDTPAEVIG